MTATLARLKRRPQSWIRSSSSGGDTTWKSAPTAPSAIVGQSSESVVMRTRQRVALMYSTVAAMTPEDWARRGDQFRLLPGETLAGVLADYAEVARRTDELVASLPDLNAAHPLPKAPWFPSGEQWSARRVLLHIITETAQHAGHADIIRESLDGAKSMG